MVCAAATQTGHVRRVYTKRFTRPAILSIDVKRHTYSGSIVGMSTPGSVSHLPVSRHLSVARDALVASALAEPQPALILLHGPAGVGKTATMSQIATAIAEQGTEVVWVQLRPDDSGRDGFWQRVLASLDRAGSLERSATLRALTAGGLIDPISVSTMIDAFAAVDEPLTIALNDFHAVADAQIEKDLIDLLATAPQLRLLVCGRSLGSLLKPIARSRVPVRVFDSKTMAFTAEETTQLLRRQQPSWTVGEVERTAHSIQQEARGWPWATMMLSTDPLPQHATRRIRASREFVTEYIDRLLADSTPEDRRILLATSLIDEISPALAAVLSGVDENRASRVLENVASTVEVPAADSPRGHWYRHHDLVRDELVARMPDYLSPDDIKGARLTIIDAVRATRPMLAVTVAIDAQDWESVEEVLKENMASVLHSSTAGFTSQPLRIPAAAFAHRPSLHALSLILQSLNPREPVARLAAGLKLSTGWTLDSYADGSPVDQVMVSALRMVAVRFAGDIDQAVGFARATSEGMELLSDDELGRYAGMLATNTSQEAATYIYAEDFASAERAFSRILGSAEPAALPEWAHAHALAAISYALQGNMPETTVAVAACERVELPLQWRESLYSSNYRIAKALGALEQGDAEAAIAEIRHVARFERQLEPWPLLTIARVLATESLAGSAEALVELERTIATHRLGLPTLAPFRLLLSQLRARLQWQTGLAVTVKRNAAPSLPLAYAFASRGDWARVADVAATVARGSANYPRRRSEALIVASLGALHSSDPVRAVERFRLANAMMRENGLVTPSRVLSSDDLEELVALASDADHGFDAAFSLPPSSTIRPTQLKPLSPAERRTLEAVYRTESVASAAESLFITPNTVRGHLKIVYRKLGVHSQREAFRRAIELGYFESAAAHEGTSHPA